MKNWFSTLGDKYWFMLCLILIVLCLCIKILSRECNNPRFYPFLNTQTYDLIQLEPFLFSPFLSPKRGRGSYAKIWGGATWPSSNQTTIEYGSSFLYVYYIYKYLCFVRCGASLCLRGVSHCAIDLHSNEIMSYSDLNDNLFGLGVGLSFGGVSPCEP